EIRIELYSGLRVEYYSTKRGLAIRRYILAALPAIIAPYSSGTILTLVNNPPIDRDLIFFPNSLLLSGSIIRDCFYITVFNSSNCLISFKRKEKISDPVPPINIPDPIPNIPEIEGEYSVKIYTLNYNLAFKSYYSSYRV
ncbi:hypothetical protein L249_0830, partial [Ophiocordyceps polyrhachis-furcata BCC 54312]